MDGKQLRFLALDTLANYDYFWQAWHAAKLGLLAGPWDVHVWDDRPPEVHIRCKMNEVLVTWSTTDRLRVAPVWHVVHYDWPRFNDAREALKGWKQWTTKES